MEDSPNVVVLVFDSLRWDSLSPCGGDRPTPAFESVAEQGLLFESAFSTAPGTPISHASLYTGQYPPEHGVTGQYINLPEDVPVMAEWFSDAGYDTFGITGPAKMGSDWRYDRGFHELFEPYYDVSVDPSLETVRKAIGDAHVRRHLVRQLTKGGRENTKLKFDLIEDRVRSGLDEPFFVFCNFLTVHAPYDPPRPYKTRATPSYSRPRLFLLEYLLGDDGEIADPNVRLDRVMNVQSGDGVGRYLADPEYLNDAEAQVLRDWYAAAVRYLDDQFERFLSFYRRELADDTVLVLTADHGEQLGEHGLWERSYRFFEETLHVPLVVVGPDVPEGVRRDDLASHVDLFDTLCDVCGLEAPEATSGRSLLGGRPREAVYMEYGERDVDAFATNSAHGRYLSRERLRELSAGRKAVRTSDYRYELTSRGTEQLYEVPADQPVPLEGSEPRETLRDDLLSVLGRSFGSWPEGDPDDMDVDGGVRENLEQLGYID